MSNPRLRVPAWPFPPRCWCPFPPAALVRHVAALTLAPCSEGSLEYSGRVGARVATPRDNGRSSSRALVRTWGEANASHPARERITDNTAGSASPAKPLFARWPVDPAHAWTGSLPTGRLGSPGAPWEWRARSPLLSPVVTSGVGAVRVTPRTPWVEIGRRARARGHACGRRSPTNGNRGRAISGTRLAKSAPATADTAFGPWRAPGAEGLACGAGAHPVRPGALSRPRPLPAG